VLIKGLNKTCLHRQETSNQAVDRADADVTGTDAPVLADLHGTSPPAAEVQSGEVVPRRSLRDRVSSRVPRGLLSGGSQVEFDAALPVGGPSLPFPLFVVGQRSGSERRDVRKSRTILRRMVSVGEQMDLRLNKLDGSQSFPLLRRGRRRSLTSVWVNNSSRADVRTRSRRRNLGPL